MKTRCKNLIYEHKHDGYRWHLKTRIHKEIVEKPGGANVCIVCNIAKLDMQFDEFLGGNICDDCANKREICILSR